MSEYDPTSRHELPHPEAEQQAEAAMSEPLTDAEVRAIRERCERATPGPWESCPGGVQTAYTELRPLKVNGEPYKNARPMHLPIVFGVLYSCAEQDAELIAGAREDIPRLLAERDRLREAVRALAESMELADQAGLLITPDHLAWSLFRPEGRSCSAELEILAAYDAALALPAVREAQGERP